MFIVAASVAVLTATWWLCAVIALLMLLTGGLGIAYLKRLYGTGHAAATWTSFVAGPGAIQASSLAAGMLLAALASIAGSFGETRSSHAEIKRWVVDPSTQPKFTTGYIDVGTYRYVTLLTRATAPKDGRAVVVVYTLDGTGRAGIVRRIEAAGNGWSLWQSRTFAKQMRLGVDLPGSGKAATQVEIALLLEDAPPQRLVDTPVATAVPAR